MKTSAELSPLVESLGALAAVITEIINARISEGLEQRRREIEKAVVPVPPPPPMERWISRREVAKHFQVSDRTISAWMRARIIPYLKQGKNVRFKLGEVEEALRRSYQLNGRGGRSSLG